MDGRRLWTFLFSINVTSPHPTFLIKSFGLQHGFYVGNRAATIIRTAPKLCSRLKIPLIICIHRARFIASAFIRNPPHKLSSDMQNIPSSIDFYTWQWMPQLPQSSCLMSIIPIKCYHFLIKSLNDYYKNHATSLEMKMYSFLLTYLRFDGKLIQPYQSQ